MKDKIIKWHKIADSIETISWLPNNLALVEAGGKKITLALYNEQVYACANKCPHASGVLGEGHLDAAGNIVCPLHGYKFNMVNGRNISGEGYNLKTYMVEKREAGIFVGFEERMWFNL